MNSETTPLVQNNPTRSRFEMQLGTEFAYMEYRFYEGRIALMHTLVPREHEGHGYAGMLAKAAFDYAKQQGIEVMVYCPFVAAYLKRHPEYLPMVVSRPSA